MSDEEIQSAIEKEYPRSGEDVVFDIDQAKNAALEGQNLVNPFEQMSNDDYVLYRKHLADKKTSFGDALGIAKDTFTNIIDEVGSGIGATAYKLAQGDIGNVAESAGAGMVAGTVGLADIAGKILNPAKPIPSKEEFIGKPTTRLIEKPQQQGVTGLTYAWPSEEADVTNEDDYNKLIEAEKQRDAGIVNNLYAMELTMRGAPIEEVSRGFQYVDPTLIAGAGGALVKSAGKTLFAKGATKAALGTAGTVGTSTAPSALTQAGLGAIENTAGAIQGVAALPSRALEGVGRIAETVVPGSGVGAKATALTASAMGDLGLTAGVVGGAKATEKVAEVVGAAARIAQQEASRVGLLEQVALDTAVSPAGRKLAAGLAQLQPVGRAAVDLTKGAVKGAAAGSVVGGALGGLAEQNLEGVAAGFGAGGALGGLTGSLSSAFELGKEAVGKSTARTQQQAAGDINSFVATRPQVEQVAWSDTMAKLASQIGPERAASQLDAMRVAEASGGKVRIATLDEAKQWQAPGWVNIDGMEIVLNPEKIRGDTAAHESAHILFSSVINRAFRPEIETAIFGLADPVSGEIVKPGILDDVALGKVAEQIRDAYGKNTVAANEFQGFANTLKNSTDADSLANARSRIADEIAATYTGRLFDRVRAGRFNPDRLPLVYRKVLSAIEDGVLDKFRSVMFEKGMDLGFDNVAKTFRNEKGKAIRIPELDAIVKKAYSQKLKVQDAENAKPDLIPVKPADRALWAKTYGGARGILNDNGTPKTQAQIDAEAAARWQDMSSRLSALPDNEKIGIDFSRDKAGKTVMTAKGQLSPTAINAILDSGALDQSAKAVLIEVLNSMQRADKSTFDTRYYGVYTRGKGGNKMVAGVKSASQNEILPYSVEINSKDGVLIRAVDMSKVRDRLATAMTKPEFKSAFDSPAEALKGFRKYMDNITQINAVDSATLLGGGIKGATRRNLFYDALGFRLRNGETLLNAPQSVINKSQNTIKSYRAERFAKLVDSGNKFAFEEATTYERALRNFQPDAFTPETLPNGEAYTNPDGFRILNKTGSKLFRTYDDTGKLIGVAESKEKAVKKAMDEATKRMEKEEPSTKRFQFAGESAEMPQFMRDSLETAKAMAKEGKDSETIRAITGWFPGKYDDKMRWEVPDQNSEIGEAWGMRASNDANEINGTPLAQVLWHKELYDAYPEARSIKVNWRRSNQRGGSFNGTEIDVFGPSLKDVHSTLLHEVQHWIQNKEGFARGGNLEVGANAIIEAKTALQRGAKSNVEVIRQKHRDAAPNVMRNDPEFARKAIAKWRQLIPEDKQSSPFGADDVDLVAFELMDKDSLLNRLSKQAYKFESVSKLDPETAYRRLAGEIESRDVQARQSFTPEQRKAIAPYSSENIAKDEAIVLKNADKPESSKRFQPVTPEQDAAYLQAVKAGDSETAQRFVDEAKSGNTIKGDYVGDDYEVLARTLLQHGNVNVYGGPRFVVKSPKLEATIDIDDGVLMIDEIEASGGFGTKMLADLFQSAQDSGIELVKLTASRSLGGWFWANRGFTPETIPLAEIKRRLNGLNLSEEIKEQVSDYLKDGDLQSLSEMSDKISPNQYGNLETKDKLFDILENKTSPLGKVLLVGTRWEAMQSIEKAMDSFGQGKAVESADPVTYDNAGNVIPLSERFNPKSSDIRFQPDPASPNILNGTDGSRIIKSNSGKYRVYLATGALAGIKDSLESAQKLVQTKSNK